MWFARVLVLLGAVVVLGCGPSAPPPPDAQTEADGMVQEIKAALEGYAESGEGLAEAGGILEGLKDVDAEKAASISKDLDAMRTLTDPGEKKAKAKEIASKL